MDIHNHSHKNTDNQRILKPIFYMLSLKSQTRTSSSASINC
jgi:hypothetical protein